MSVRGGIVPAKTNFSSCFYIYIKLKFSPNHIDKALICKKTITVGKRSTSQVTTMKSEILCKKKKAFALLIILNIFLRSNLVSVAFEVRCIVLIKIRHVFWQPNTS